MTPEQRTERRNRRRQKAVVPETAAEPQGAEAALTPIRANTSRLQIHFSEPISMDIDQRPQSPISSELSQLNEQDSLMANQPYEQSTLIGDNTVIGGLSQGSDPAHEIVLPSP